MATGYTTVVYLTLLEFSRSSDTEIVRKLGAQIVRKVAAAVKTLKWLRKREEQGR